MLKELKTLSNGIRVLMEAHPNMNEPKLHLELDNTRVAITTNSNEYDNDYGEFMVYPAVLPFLSAETLPSEIVKIMLDEIADPKSIRKIEARGWTKFTLKPELLEKLLDFISETGM